MANFIKNGDFANGTLEAWSSIGNGVAVYDEGSEYYVRLSKGGAIQQNTEVPTGESRLEFQVRTREPLIDGEFILFTATLAFSLNQGGVQIIPFLDGATSRDWRKISWKVPFQAASDLVIQLTASTPELSSSRLSASKAPFGTVEFKDFSLNGPQ